VWYCHSDSCKKNGQRAGGNAIDFVSVMENCSAYGAAKRIDEWFPSGNGQERSVEPHDGMMTKEVFDAQVNPVNNPLAFMLPADSAHPMIQAKGITAETAVKWNVGYYKSKQGNGSMDDRIIFPLYECGSLVGYIGRTVLEVTQENPKWKKGKGLIMSFLYGLERCDPSKPVVVTESAWAVLWLYQNGVQAASLLGKEMTAEQEKCLEPFGTVQLALDNDPAGREASERLAERLRPRHKVIRSFLLEK